MNIPFILEKALNLYAEKEAVVCSQKRFTYRQFADRTFRLAHYLKTMGIGKGDCVAILHQNSHQFIEAYFAVAQLGAILNPLNIRLSPGSIGLVGSVFNSRKFDIVFFFSYRNKVIIGRKQIRF